MPDRNRPKSLKASACVYLCDEHAQHEIMAGRGNELTPADHLTQCSINGCKIAAITMFRVEIGFTRLDDESS